MLKEVHIQNYVLIDRLDIEFNDGFSVMTGETGAGKSIILGAMNLLQGGRADAKSLRQGQDKCTIEGHFSIAGYGLEQFFSENDIDIDTDDTIVRREIYSSGKSRAFINDTPVSLALLRILCSRLIDIHSQHQNLALGTESFQLDTVDTIAGDGTLLSEYSLAFDEWSSLSARLRQLKAEFESDTTDREYLQFQLDGIQEAHLTDGEQEELEQESELLEHAEEIKQDLFHAAQILENEEGGTIQEIRQALQALRSAQRNFRQAEDLSARMDSCLIELKDISDSIIDAQDSVSFNPERLQKVNDRLDLIYSLEKKHRKENIAQLLEYAQEISARLKHADSYEDDIRELTNQVKLAFTRMQKAASVLSESRRKAAQTIETDISKLLVPLGIPNVRFGISISEASDYDRTGHDSITFMFSANKAVPMQELSQVASGGEIARVMLSIKSLVAGARTMPTVIFDEIDTGVSGAVAEKMALLMKRMSGPDRQVLAITHLPQIAAMGQTHYKVFKTDESDATHTRIAVLDGEDRIREIAGMMSGSTLTQAALDNAKALIDNNGR
ncbi:MAG: DNA repair protein RecN [Bacteroidaceae bacterium]|nr:DNA repair protein RecN [Bacteroidaceae bacterium]